MSDTEYPVEEFLPSQSATSIPVHGSDDQVAHWFPMRVAYGKILRVDKELELLGIEYFLPANDKVEAEPDETTDVKVVKSPIISNLIFLHSSKKAISELKHSSAPCRYLRFITYIPKSQLRPNMTSLEKSNVNRILTIPDAEMTQFIHVMTQMINHVTLIPYSDVFKYIGHKIRILQGPLAGCIGTLRRIQKNKHVHVDCGGILTAELGYMPRMMYELLE